MEVTGSEIMAVAASKLLKDGDKVLVGIGLPQVAVFLAKKTHAPRMSILMENGVYGSDPVDTGVGIADPRAWYGATRMSGSIEMMGKLLQRGRINVGMLGALEVDQYGNVNSTMVTAKTGVRHFTGSGGACDMACLSERIIVIARHEKRKMTETVQYITSPGFLSGGDARLKSGLKSGGPVSVITDKGVCSFDPATKKMYLESYHPGFTARQIAEETGFDIDISRAKETELPTEHEVKLMREVIDPGRMYIGSKSAH